MMRSRSKVESMFKRFDTDGDGIVPFEIFRAGKCEQDCKTVPGKTRVEIV